MSARVNLLPREIEERAKARRTTSWTIGAVAAYAALLGLVYIGKLGDLNSARADRDNAQDTVTTLQQELATLQEYAELDRQVTARNDLLAAAMATQISWARVLNDLSLTFPPSSSLTTLGGESATVTAAAAGGAPAPATPTPTGEAAGAVSFEGYSVERLAPGVERVLIKFEEAETFRGSYLTEAVGQVRGQTEVMSFIGNMRLTDGAYTGRYEQGLPPEVQP